MSSRLDVLAIVSVIIVAMAGCEMGPKSGRGFTLPEGDVAVGRETFQRLNCHACHAVEGMDQIAPLGDDHDAKPQRLSVALGGEVSRIKTYGELVTSIINPSHRFARGYSPDAVQTEEGDSKMPIYNDRMTVTELTDLVAFLQSQYKLHPQPPTTYPPYY